MADTPTPDAAALPAAASENAAAGSKTATVGNAIAPSRAPAPDMVTYVRRRYQEGAAVRTIAAETGIGSRHVIYGCLDGRYADESGMPPPPIARRRQGARANRRRGSRGALVNRIWRTAQKQIEDIEDRLDAAGLAPGERESGARIVAAVARTLRELSALDETNAPRRRTKRSTDQDSDDGSTPRNVEDLRRSLAQKLDALIAERGDGVPEEAG